jgi:hypothetical protein
VHSIGTTPDPAHAPQLPLSGEEFLSRFGDAIDDRIEEILDELIQERNATPHHRRLPLIPAIASLALALTAYVVLRHSTAAAWTIWLATDCTCIAAIWNSAKS